MASTKAKIQAKIFEDTVKFFIDEARKNLTAAANLTVTAAAADDDDDDAKTVTTFGCLSVESDSREPPKSSEEKKSFVLAPKNVWHKYIWLCYRRCLTIIHGEEDLQAYFHQLAKQVMAYCVEFERKVEFVKLVVYLRDCEVSKKRRKKLDASKEKVKLSAQNASLYHDTFIHALDICMKFEIYEQAALLLMMIEKTTKFFKRPKNMPTEIFKHYEKLAKFFWAAGAYDFHASVLIKSYEIFAENQRNKFDSNKRIIYATRIILAVCCVSKNSKQDKKSHKNKSANYELEIEDDAEALYLKNKVGDSSGGKFFGSSDERPTWQSLSLEISRLQLMSYCNPIAKKLYKSLDECKFREAKDQLADICRTETRCYMPYYDRLKILIESELFADTAYKGGYGDYAKSRSTSGYSNASGDHRDENNPNPFYRREPGKPKFQTSETTVYVKEADPGYGGLSTTTHSSSDCYRSGPTPLARTQLVISTTGEITWRTAPKPTANRGRPPKNDSRRDHFKARPCRWPSLSHGNGHLWSSSSESD